MRVIKSKHLGNFTEDGDGVLSKSVSKGDLTLLILAAPKILHNKLEYFCPLGTIYKTKDRIDILTNMYCMCGSKHSCWVNLVLKDS